MAASFALLPQPVSLCQEPMRVVIQSDLVSTSYAQLKFIFNNPTGPSLGNLVRLNWLEKTVLLIIGGAHTSDSENIPTVGSSGADETYIKLFCETLRNIEKISDDFSVTYAQANSKWVVTMQYLTRDALVVSISAGSFDNVLINAIASDGFYTKTNLSAILRIEKPDGSLLLKVNPSYQSLTGQNTFVDVRSAFDLKPTLPSFSDLKGIATDSFTPYVLRVADKYGTVPITDPFIASGVFYAIWGGRAPFSLQDFVPNESGFYACFANSTKKITKTQKLWAYFFNTSATGDFYASLKLKFNDGLTVQYSFGPKFYLNANTLNYIACDYLTAGVDSLCAVLFLDPKNLVGYDFNLVTAGSYISKLILSTEFDTCFYDSMYLAYSNGLGGIDTLHIRGYNQIRSDFERVVAERYFTNEMNAQDGSMLTIESKAQRTFDIETGYITAEYAAQLSQLLLGDVWLIDNTNSRYIKLIADSKSLVYKQKKPGMINLAMSFKDAFKSRNFV